MSWQRMIAACALVAVLGGAPAHAGYVVVRNARNPTAKLAKAQVKQVFGGRMKLWSSGENVVLVIGSEDSPAMKWLAETVFGVSAKTFLAKIKQDVFRGDMIHPLSADDDAKTLKRVQSGTGVIGIVSDTAAKSLPADVAIVAVE